MIFGSHLFYVKIIKQNSNQINKCEIKNVKNTIMSSKRKLNMERACPDGSMSPYVTTGCVYTVR